MATPQVPPRPSRSHQHQPAATSSDTSLAAPRIPPRPAGQRKERSVSPTRYAPSPLNILPRKTSASGLYSHANANRSASSIDSPARPPSVTLPSIGQEGNEYGDLERHDQQSALERTLSDGTEAHTSHIDSELPLHAPKPSLAKSSARAQVAAVTRTDSGQAAAAGFGSLISPRDDRDPFSRPLKSRASSTQVRTPSAASDREGRPGSTPIEEQGIPQIGRQVPMLPYAGDVQAPEARQRHHGRKHSGREIFHGPPGSYGLHGHGITGVDRFEKNWYAKHPDELVKEEHGHYSPALSGERHEWALSSDDLNKIVKSTAKGAGFGTSASIVGLPDEQIGYLASDEFASRLNSPRSPTARHHKRALSQPHVESPLRQEAFPPGTMGRVGPGNNKVVTSEQAVEGEEEDVIHIDPPEDRINKVTGEGVETTHESLALRRTSSDADGAFAEEHGYSAPILASDEVTPGSEWQQPAISPGLVPDRRGSAQFDDFGHLHRHLSHLGSANSSRQGSRAGSRPGSIHGIPALSKMTSYDEHEERHTPLEDVDEFEPLFPDDDGKTKKPMTQADRFKRRADLKQRFPSQDIWEDTPHSLQLETEVTSPDLPDERTQQRMGASLSAFETPEQEAARKDAAARGSEQDITLTPTEELLSKAGLKSGVAGDVVHRFPSHDIWEDSPDYAALTTTVQGPDEGEAAEAVTSKLPTIPPRPDRSKNGDAPDNVSQQKVPPRPPKKQTSTDSTEGEVRKPPSVPGRPKPQIPPRPGKTASQDSNENAPLAKSMSAGSTGSAGDDISRPAKPAPPTKPKPMVPSRPAGSKIAALQAGFMADLNSRLKTGPPVQQPAAKVEERPEERAPLQDARKGRARGPARRKPAAHSASPQPAADPTGSQLHLATVWTVWQTGADGRIEVPKAEHGKATRDGIEIADTAAQLTPRKVTDDAPVVEEPKALSEQSTRELNESAPSGDKEPELPVMPGSIPNDVMATESSGHKAAPPIDAAAPSSIAGDEVKAKSEPVKAQSATIVPDEDEVVDAANKEPRKADVVAGEPTLGDEPGEPPERTEEALLHGESAQVGHVQGES